MRASGRGRITNSGFQGYNYGAPTDTTNYSGANYLGSDGDYVVLNGVTQRFAFNHPVAGLTGEVAGQSLQTGSDFFIAGAGSDTFVFLPATGDATIQGFDPAQDQIVLSGHGLHDFNEVLGLTVEDADGNSVIQLGPNDSITLLDVHRIALGAQDFVFL